MQFIIIDSLGNIYSIKIDNLRKFDLWACIVCENIIYKHI